MSPVREKNKGPATGRTTKVGGGKGSRGGSPLRWPEGDRMALQNGGMKNHSRRRSSKRPHLQPQRLPRLGAGEKVRVEGEEHFRNERISKKSAGREGPRGEKKSKEQGQRHGGVYQERDSSGDQKKKSMKAAEGRVSKSSAATGVSFCRTERESRRG